MNSNPQKDLPAGKLPKKETSVEETLKKSADFLKQLQRSLQQSNEFNAKARAFVDQYLGKKKK